MQQYDEKELIERAKTDPQSFGLLYEMNYDKILNYVLRRTANAEVSYDITSETFFKALKNIRSFTWQNVPFSAWLYKIAINEIAAFHRKGKFISSSLNELSDNGFEPASSQDLEQEMIEAQEEVDRHEKYLIVREKIESLPQKYSEVLSLRFFGEKQISEIAQILSKSEGTIKSLLHRGLEKIKKDLPKEL